MSGNPREHIEGTKAPVMLPPELHQAERQRDEPQRDEQHHPDDHGGPDPAEADRAGARRHHPRQDDERHELRRHAENPEQVDAAAEARGPVEGPLREVTVDVEP